MRSPPEKAPKSSKRRLFRLLWSTDECVRGIVFVPGGGVREREKEAKIERFSRCTEMYGLFLSSGVMEAVFISCMHGL